jgi:hypothetical protein
MLLPDTRTLWQTLAYAARLRITGYNLFVHYITRRNRPPILTLQRNTGIIVLDVP